MTAQHAVRTSLISIAGLVASLALSLGSPRAFAQTALPNEVGPAPAPADSSVRIAGMVGTDAAMLGITASRPLRRWFGLEGMVAFGGAPLENKSAAALSIEGLARFGYYGERHAVTVGVGPSLLESGTWGPVGFVQSELSYEYRIRGAVSLLLGVGPSMALNDSRRNPCNETGLFGCGFFHRDQFRAGDLSMRWRLGLGLAY